MEIVISNTSGDPIYQQIFEQIGAQILKGNLPSDTCLPSIRTVAKELRISVITVKRAWEELEHAGLIYTMAGKGCFVTPLQPNALIQKRSQLAGEKMAKDLEYYKTLGLSLDEIIDMLKKDYEKG
ncbi:MAG TPA: GntR family transcriptional regulator [Anaerolineaceae bacterium]|nr:GntR family transcriptional regulator [Anaerolineaceae bacterium]